MPCDRIACAITSPAATMFSLLSVERQMCIRDSFFYHSKSVVCQKIPQDLLSCLRLQHQTDSLLL